MLWRTSVPCRALSNAREVHRRSNALHLYKAILVQLYYFFDQHASNKIHREVIKHIRASLATPEDKPLVPSRWLKILRKANVGDLAALRCVIQHAYGQRGKLRHTYLADFQPALSTAMPLIPGNDRTKLPVVSERLQAIWSNQSNIAARSKPKLPTPRAGLSGKPLDKRRQANFLWRHHTNLLKKTLPPIPASDYANLAGIANGTAIKNSKFVKWPKDAISAIPQWRRVTHQEMCLEVQRKTTDPHTLTPRLIRRIYSSILATSPVMKHEQGKWKARFEK